MAHKVNRALGAPLEANTELGSQLRIDVDLALGARLEFQAPN